MFDRGATPALHAVVLTLTIAPWIVIAVQSWRLRARPPPHDVMRVDATGLHWLRGNEVRRSLRWRDLRQSPGTDADVVVRTLGGRVNGIRASHDVLTVWIASPTGPVAELVYFRGGRLSTSFFGNSDALRARFVLGIRTFRPRLRIDARVYGTFFIDRSTGVHDLTAQRRTRFAGCVVAALILLAIYGYVFHLRG